MAPLVSAQSCVPAPRSHRDRKGTSFLLGSQLKGGAQPCTPPSHPLLLRCCSAPPVPRRPGALFAPHTLEGADRWGQGLEETEQAPRTHQSGWMGTLLEILIVPACCRVTLAQPQCHWQHDTKTQNHSEVQRGVCNWQDPALAVAPCSLRSLLTPGTGLG